MKPDQLEDRTCAGFWWSYRFDLSLVCPTRTCLRGLRFAREVPHWAVPVAEEAQIAAEARALIAAGG